jgi:hypothetical protein
MQSTIRLSVVLADGTRYDFTAAKMPRHWKSWVMQQCPYGTPFMGCRFERKAI